MEKIDTWIIEKVYQPYADWVTKLTGKSSYWQGMIATGLWLITVALRTGDDIKANSRWDIGIDAFVILMSLWMIFTLSDLDKRFRESTTWVYAYEMRHDSMGMFIRLMVTFLTPILFGDIRQLAGGILLSMALYLPCCTPKKPPPKPVQEQSNDPSLVPNR